MKTAISAMGALVLVAALTTAGTRVRVEERGRGIQRDGFLPEWDAAEARRLGDGEGISWDVVNTTEGLAGYVRFSRARTCSSWTLRFFPDMRALQRPLVMSIDTADGGWFYSVYEWEDDTAGMVSAEWIIPWDTVNVDSTGEYELGMYAVSDCGDTLESVVLAGTRSPATETRSVFTPKVVAQIVIVAALLVLYLVLQARARKKYLQKPR